MANIASARESQASLSLWDGSKGKRCQKNRQKSSPLIPISSGLSELHWFRSDEGEFHYPAHIANCLIRKDKVAGRRMAHIVIELISRAIALGLGGPKVLPINLLTGGLIVIHQPELSHLSPKLAGISARIEWMPALTTRHLQKDVCNTSCLSVAMASGKCLGWGGDGTF
ncbi:hypothetical protein [Mesorhizobium sp. LjRoot246]|uniref:hypothetical protein n=1 Tax=Mesorhizobium sp. LjRoot246 TaxID=3342294 RepID=UPI003ED0DB39